MKWTLFNRAADITGDGKTHIVIKANGTIVEQLGGYNHWATGVRKTGVFFRDGGYDGEQHWHPVSDKHIIGNDRQGFEWDVIWDNGEEDTQHGLFDCWRNRDTVAFFRPTNGTLPKQEESKMKKTTEEQMWGVWWSFDGHNKDNSETENLRGKGVSRTAAILEAANHPDVAGAFRDHIGLGEWIDNNNDSIYADAYYHVGLLTNKNTEIEAVRLTLSMWTWLAEHPDCGKKAWPDYEPGLHQDCHLCEEWFDQSIGDCTKCPLKEASERCNDASTGNLFGRWVNTTGHKRAQAAFGIAAIAREWLENNDPEWSEPACKQR
jgi:hypothetical protein